MTLKDTKNAEILIVNKQTNNGENDRIEVTCDGNFFEKKGVYYLFYSEINELGETEVRMVMEDGKVTLNRTGISKAKIEYKTGLTHSFRYCVPYGDILMTVHTFEVDYHFNESGGTIYLRYTLDIQQEIFKNEMQITINKKGVQ